MPGSTHTTIDHVLGELSVETFLRDYWQKKPVLIRGAIPGFESPLAPEELAGLACEADAPSRLILEHGEERDWQLKMGPFSEDDFRALPEDGYSLLVTDCEKLIPELMEIVERFRFVPDWRIDDLMISYAPPGGSVGAHIDDYDVFLLQAHGRRRWQIENPPVHTAYREGLDVRILTDFTPTDEWVLEPGDMLYLPPGIPHHGVALDDCMTYSVGFRAPTQADLVGGVCDRLATVATEDRYRDPDLTPAENPGELPVATRERLRQWVLEAMATDDSLVDRLIAETLTERPVDHAALYPRYHEEEIAGILDHLNEVAELQRTPASRWLLLEPAGDDPGRLCIDGQSHELDAESLPLARFLSQHIVVEGEALAERASNASARILLEKILTAGQLLIPDEDEQD
ncbi:cupin domain-containing protein [Guyparkeria hydrothermalis]|uniref:cupin domain-containing protein n=1 Tax=Guyparkeria hydrothermalis TaxID=923 RepID=UPI002022368C|nr:cupin domain-containing protein [Guyparkeria hydrothermalis]MCL7743484.1 cupin domain-containing protein [Guyparkeria hydrothermalis]